ncbi:MFS transporter [Aestuariispira ectoiniformans]|uniref:MFS transporter n=1 Tax=Aestuariispira ectoiniformans TaxID=2775080 RepID=UPI00223BDD02|nr:MFS transporter [Aestuariispira ectoiniformans]
MGHSKRFNLACVIAAMFVVNMVYSLSLPLLAVRLDAMGITETVIGLNTAVQPLAGVLVAPFFPALLSRFGAKPILITALVTIGVVFPLFTVMESLSGWFVLRAFAGAAACALWVVSEAWIHDLAEDHSRGRVIGVYATAGSAGLAIGPLILALTGTATIEPFLIGAGLCLICLIPVMLADGGSYSVEKSKGKGGLIACLLFAPLPMVINLVMSASYEATHAFLPLVPAGVGEKDIFLLLGLLGVGGMLSQYPMGWLADRMNRLALVAGLTLGEFLMILGYQHFLTAEPAGIIYFLFWGTAGSALYGMGVLLVGHFFKGHALAVGSAAFSAMYNVGVLVGPSTAGVMVDVWQGDGLMLYLAGAAILIFPATAWTAMRAGRATEKLV